MISSTILSCFLLIIIMQISQINTTKTQFLRANPKYSLFLEWLKHHGAIIHPHIKYPTAFSSSGYVGVSTEADLEAKEAVIAIPYSLVIDIQRVLSCEQLTTIINQNKKLFPTNDSSFDAIVLYLMYERCKGDKSFYYLYFEVAECSNLLYGWNNKELTMLENEELIENIYQYKQSCDFKFMQFMRVIKKYSNVFVANLTQLQYRRIFQWAYEFVMTRAFGWSVPSTALVPFADMLNHNDVYLDHYLVDVTKELNHEADYKKKRSWIDLSILDTKLVPADKSHIHKQIPSERSDYITKFHQNYDQNHQKQLIAKINYKLYTNKTLNFRQIDYHDSSCSEDDEIDSEEQQSYNQIQQAFQKIERLQTKNKCFDIHNIIRKYWVMQQQSLMEAKQVFKGQLPINQQTQATGSEQEDDQNQQKFPWIKSSKLSEVYFTMFPIRKTFAGQQIYNFYGRRSNRFLLLGYNFALLDNKYDSFYFRMLVQPQSNSIPDIKDLVFSKSRLSGQRMPNAIITREINLKAVRINMELLNNCRCLIVSKCINVITSPVSITTPFNRQIQIMCLQLYESIINYFLKRYSTSLYDDLKLIDDNTFTQRMKTALVVRISHKRILISHLGFVHTCRQYLGRWKQGRLQDIKQSEMEKMITVNEYLRSLQRSVL